MRDNDLLTTCLPGIDPPASLLKDQTGQLRVIDFGGIKRLPSVALARMLRCMLVMPLLCTPNGTGMDTPNLLSLLPTVTAVVERAGALLATECVRPGGRRGFGDNAEIDGEIEVGLRAELLKRCWAICC